MTTIHDLYIFLDGMCPGNLSCAWDNDGMMCIPDAGRAVRRVLCALDVTERTIEEAEDLACDCIVSHHPMIFQKLSRVTESDAAGRRVIRLLAGNISVMSFHTRLDAAAGGVNDTLCRKLGLTVTGTFGADGEALGRLAECAMEMPLASFCAQVKSALGTPALHVVSSKKPIRRVAVLGGDGKDDWEAALASGADTYLTGTMSYNALLDAKAAGLNVIAAGHFFTERPVMETVAKWIGDRFPDVEAVVSVCPCEILTI